MVHSLILEGLSRSLIKEAKFGILDFNLPGLEHEWIKIELHHVNEIFGTRAAIAVVLMQ